MIHKDIVIVGKGIAGLVLAILLKRKQIDFVLVDRFNKGKLFAYGETLPPSAMPLLNNLGLLDLFTKHSYRKTFGYHSCWGSDQVVNTNFYHHNPYKYGLKIDKEGILNVLAEEVQDHIISYKKEIEIIESNQEITKIILDRSQEIHGSLFIDATGRKRALLNKLSVDSESYDDLLAYSCHIPKKKHPNLIHEVYVESFKEGWGIVSALNQNENVCSIFTRKGTSISKKLTNYNQWRDILSETKFLKDFIVDIDAVKIIGGNANSSRAEKISRNNWLSIGDAAIAFDPLSSHGITNAIYTSWVASDSIENFLHEKDNGLLEDYESTIEMIFKQYLDSKNQLYLSEKRWKDSEFWKPIFKLETVSI